MFFLLVALFCFYVAARSIIHHLLAPAVVLSVMGSALLAQSISSFLHGA